MDKLEKFLRKKQELENEIAFFDQVIDNSRHFMMKANGSEWHFSKHNSVLYDDIVNLMYIERHNLRGQLLDIKCTIVQMEKLI